MRDRITRLETGQLVQALEYLVVAHCAEVGGLFHFIDHRLALGPLDNVGQTENPSLVVLMV